MKEIKKEIINNDYTNLILHYLVDIDSSLGVSNKDVIDRISISTSLDIMSKHIDSILTKINNIGTLGVLTGYSQAGNIQNINVISEVPNNTQKNYDGSDLQHSFQEKELYANYTSSGLAALATKSGSYAWVLMLGFLLLCRRQQRVYQHIIKMSTII